MAHTKRGRELTEQHRQRQVDKNRALIVLLLEWLRSDMDYSTPESIDMSFKVFLRRALPAIVSIREDAARETIEYLEDFRRIELEAVRQSPGDSDDAMTVNSGDVNAVLDRKRDQERDRRVRQKIDDLPSETEITKELYGASAAVAKREKNKGTPDADIRKKVDAAVSSKVTEQVSDGSRAPLKAEVEGGKRMGVTGYCRVPDMDPCPFCAMLASRGAVYRSDAFKASSATFNSGIWAVHSGCECSMEPIYGKRVTDLPPGAQDLAEQWAEVAAGRPDAWAAWRRWRESGTLPGDERSDAAERLDDASYNTPSKRGKAKPNTSKDAKRQRRDLSDLDTEELQRTVKGIMVRREGLLKQIAELEEQGVSRKEPGVMQALLRQIERTDRQLEKAGKLLT